MANLEFTRPDFETLLTDRDLCKIPVVTDPSAEEGTAPRCAAFQLEVTAGLPLEQPMKEYDIGKQLQWLWKQNGWSSKVQLTTLALLLTWNPA